MKIYYLKTRISIGWYLSNIFKKWEKNIFSWGIRPTMTKAKNISFNKREDFFEKVGL